jgi:hypothetical protein
VILGIPAWDRIGTGLCDEQPGGALVIAAGSPAVAAVAAAPATAPAAVAGPDQREPSGQLLPAQSELQLARPDGLPRVPRQLGLERAPVPADRIARAVLALRDDPLEIEVLDRMVLRPGGEAAFVGIPRGALGEGPRGEHAVDLEPQVVVKATGAVPMDDEPTAAARDSGSSWHRVRRGGEDFMP